MAEHLRFETVLDSDVATVWGWITNWDCILTEMRPWLSMTWPKGSAGMSLEDVQPGVPLGRSTVRAFGLIPVDWSELTLLEIEPGRGFVEQSPMGSMRMWRHERYIEPSELGCTLVDELTFEPRFLPRLARRIVKAFFRHRHRQLARHLGR